MVKKQAVRASIILSSGLIFSCFLLSLFIFSSSASANTPLNPELTITRTPSVTPEPTATLAPTGTPKPKPKPAAIILTMPDPGSVLWTSVQWQNEHGDWIDVSGWQSDFNENNMVVWAVAPDEYGTGPYRWVVYLEKDGDVQSMSDIFYLPDNRQTMFIAVAD